VLDHEALSKIAGPLLPHKYLAMRAGLDPAIRDHVLREAQAVF